MNCKVFVLHFSQDAAHCLPHCLGVRCEPLPPLLPPGALHIAVDMEDAAPVPEGEAGRPPADLRVGEEAEDDSVRRGLRTHLPVVALEQGAALGEAELCQVIPPILSKLTSRQKHSLRLPEGGHTGRIPFTSNNVIGFSMDLQSVPKIF